jgi:hypothetical protein
LILDFLRTLRRGPPAEGSIELPTDGPLPLAVPEPERVVRRLDEVLANPGSLPVELARRVGRLVLRARITGSWQAAAPEVAASLAFLEPSVPRRDPPAAAEVLTHVTGAALAWPALAGSRRTGARGMAHLARVGGARARADGTPPDGDALALLGWVEAALLLAADARAEGIALPPDLIRAITASADHVWWRGAPNGTLPPGSSGPVLAPVGLAAASARNATLAWGWASGSPAPSTDGGALARALGGHPSGTPSLPVDDDWSLRTWADGGVVVLHRGGKKPARVVVDAGCPHPQGEIPGPELEVQGVAALPRAGQGWAAGRGPFRVESARVDVSTGRAPRRARVVLVGHGVRRQIEARQLRLIVEDTPDRAGQVRIRWTFGAGWKLAPDANPPTASHPAGPSLRLGLDPRLTWRADGPALVGSGTYDAGDEAFRFSVEWT